MKQFLLCCLMLVMLAANGQKNKGGLILTKGQKFTLKTTITQDADMGMGMQMKNFSTTQNSFSVIGADEKNYTVVSMITSINLNVDFMGQNMTYDSDKKEDSASEIAKSIPKINVPDTSLINKQNGTVTSIKIIKDTAAETANPLENIMKSFGPGVENASLAESFFIIPAGLKTGDSWVDSSNTNGTKSSRTYTIKSIDKNIAVISLVGNMLTDTKTELQGMQVTINMNNKMTGEITTDVKTELVSKRTVVSDVTGTMEVMGQSLPVTAKSTIEAVYSY